MYKFKRPLIYVLIFVLISVFSFGTNFQLKNAQATDKTWDFSSASDYTFDNTKIETSSGQAQVKATGTPVAWYNNSWHYRKAITIDHTKVSGNLTNFPVYMDLSSDPDLAVHAQADGDDILFTSSNGITKLDHDLSMLYPTTELTSDGAWCWFQDPKAVHYEGTQNKTYVGWVNRSGDVQIRSYDHNAKTFDTATLHPALQVDDHANPSILIRPDGRLMVFYSAHAGANMFYRLSTNPEDISSWGVEQTVGTNTPGGNGYSYPNPVQLSSESNKIYLFWRGGNWEPTFSTSTDGVAWSPAQTLFNVPGERPYTKVVSDGAGKIHFTFTDGHPAAVANNNIYYAYYFNGAFYKAGGTFIKTMADVVAGNPLLPAELDKVYDAVAGGSRGWNWDIALDGSGNPVIVYANFPTTSDHRYRYARWTGSAWSDHEITPAGGYIDGVGEPYYSGGITLDHNNPSITYLSREISGTYEIEKWTTPDGGATWSSEVITSESGRKNVRPIVPRGYTSGDLGVIWMHGDYPSYTTYDTTLEMQSIPITAPSISTAQVRVPILSSTSDTVIYMYYGNPAASDQSNPTGVWDSNFKMVQHLDDNIAGKINKAANFNGINDYIDIGSGINMASWNALTFEAWVKYEEGVKVADKYTIVSNWLATTDKAAIMARIEPAGDTLQAYVITQPNTSVGGAFADVHFDSNWHHLVVTYDTLNGLKAYLDNVVSATSYASVATLDADASQSLNLGYTQHDTTDGFQGRIDEARISNTARSVDWISTEYKNQNSPSTFYGAGSEVSFYPTDNPTIQPIAANSQAFTSLSGFSEIATKNGGEIKYQISNDSGTTWYWYNLGWKTTVSGYSEANTAADINNNITTFPTGAGQFLFRAYFHSDGTQLVKLDNIGLTFALSPPVPPSPSSDITPPSLSISYPNADWWTYGRYIPIRGNVFDTGSGIDSVRIYNMQSENTDYVSTINSDGYFEQYVWLEPNSLNDLRVIARDRAGNESTIDLTIQQLASSLSRYIPSAQASSEAIELENMGNQAVVFGSIYDSELDKWIKITDKSENIIYSQLPKFKGTTIPDGKVDFYTNSDQEVHDTATADSKGDWQYQVTQALAYGDHTIYATVTDKNGNISQPTEKVVFTIKNPSEMPLASKIEKNLREFQVWWIFAGLAIILTLLFAIPILRRKRH